MKVIIGLILIIASIVFGVWLGLWIMLYGGIMQAIENWGIDNSAVVWGIIRAVFSQLGAIPAYFGIFIGILLIDS